MRPNIENTIFATRPRGRIAGTELPMFLAGGDAAVAMRQGAGQRDNPISRNIVSRLPVQFGVVDTMPLDPLKT